MVFLILAQYAAKITLMVGLQVMDIIKTLDEVGSCIILITYYPTIFLVLEQNAVKTEHYGRI